MRSKKLQRFAEKWSPAPAAAEALRLRETLAAKALASIKKIKAPYRRRGQLKSFLRTYAGTQAGREAKKLLSEMTR